MRGAPDQRFLFLRGLRQILRIPSTDASVEPSSSVAATILDDPQRPPRRYDRPRTTAGSGIGLTQDQDEAPALPPTLQDHGQALQRALQGSSTDLERALQEFIRACFDSPQHTAAASRFILHHFFTRLPVLARVITPANLFAELQHGGSLLTQVIALRWDQTGENDRLHQLAQLCIDHSDDLTSSQAAEFTTALAAAIAFRKPALARTLIEHAKPRLDEDADEQLIPDAEQCLDAGLVLEHLDSSTRETWCHRLRFADRNWNWETRESQRILDILAEHLQPDARCAPLFEQIIPEAQWQALFRNAVPPSRSEQSVSSVSDVPQAAAKPTPTVEPVIESASLAEVPAVLSAEPLSANNAAADRPNDEPVANTEALPVAVDVSTVVEPGTSVTSAENAPPASIEAEAPAAISVEAPRAEGSAEVPPVVTGEVASETQPATPAPVIAPEVPTDKVEDPKPAANATVAQNIISEPTASKTAPPQAEVKASEPEKPTEKPAAITSTDEPTKSEPTTAADGKPTASKAPAKEETATETSSAKPSEAKPVQPRPRGRLLPFVTGMTCGLFAALGVWSTVPENQQTLVKLVQGTPLQSLLAQASIGQPPSLAPVPTKPATHAPAAPARSRVTPPTPPKPAATDEPKPEPKPKPAPEPEFVGPPMVIASLIASVEFIGPPFPAPTPPAEEPPATIVSKPVVLTEFERWKQGRIDQILREFPALEAWHANAQSSRWKDASVVIAGRHPAAPAKSAAHRAFLTLLVLDPPGDRDVLRASHIAFARNLSAKDCLEIWEPLIAQKASNSPEIRNAASIMAELMASQLSGDTRQRLERIVASH